MAVPDQTVTIDYVVAEGDLVAAHLTATQTLATGEQFSGLEIVGIVGDKIAWRRGYGDDTFHASRRQVEMSAFQPSRNVLFLRGRRKGGVRLRLSAWGRAGMALSRNSPNQA
jgi:hypothetical protein